MKGFAPGTPSLGETTDTLFDGFGYINSDRITILHAWQESQQDFRSFVEFIVHSDHTFDATLTELACIFEFISRDPPRM